MALKSGKLTRKYEKTWIKWPTSSVQHKFPWRDHIACPSNRN